MLVCSKRVVLVLASPSERKERFSIRRNINFTGGFVRPLETYTYRRGKGEVGSVVDFLHDKILKNEVKTSQVHFQKLV